LDVGLWTSLWQALRRSGRDVRTSRNTKSRKRSHAYLRSEQLESRQLLAVYDSFSVSSLGGIATSPRILDDGAAYTVSVSGFVSIQNAQSRLGDAEYFQVWDAVNKRKTGEWADVSSISGVDMGLRLSQVTGAGKWGPRNTTGNYSQVVGGTGNRLQVRFIDSPYTDNSGNFSVTVHHDVPVSVSAIEPTAKEKNQIAGTFRITRGGSTRYPLSVTFALSGTSSDGAADYITSAASTVIIPADETYVDITITPVDDAVVETDEAVTLTLRPSPQYDLVTGATSAIVTIEDDDRVVVTIEEFDRHADEVMERAGVHRTGTLHVVRTGKLDDPLLVKVRIGGTATYSALAFDDYTLENVTSGWTGYFVTIPAGLSSTQVVVTPIQDGIDEDTETVIITVEAYTGYELGEPSTQSGTVEILDAPNLAGASITYQIEVDARKALYARAYEVDGDEHPLPPGGNDTLWTGEPYIFSLFGLADERTDGLAWEIWFRTEPGDFDTGAVIADGSGNGASFSKAFAVETEEYPLIAAGAWHVRFYVDANRDGSPGPSESAVAGNFAEVEQNRKDLYVQRLRDEQQKHSGFLYDSSYAITGFYDALIARASEITYSRLDGTALGDYSYSNNNLRILDVEKASINTIVHEAAHALDDARNGSSLDYSYLEGLAYTAETFAVSTGPYLTPLVNFEAILDTSPTDDAAVQREWERVLRAYSQIGFKVTHLFGFERNATEDDFRNARNALGMTFNLDSLRSLYQSQLASSGSSSVLGMTYTDGGQTKTVLDVFRE
jgi:hypothetical protein